MNRRMPVLASACVAAACAAAPSLAVAAPHHSQGLTIYTTPHRIIAGDPVIVHGRLLGRHSADQKIVLWHRLNPSHRFTVIGRTTTDAQGRYAFTRAQGIVNTNRSWYVRGPSHSHSRTTHERVAAEVTLVPSATEGTTGHPLTFTGHVTAYQAGHPVMLQVQRGDGDGWRTVDVTRVGAGSNYSFTRAFGAPGALDVRVYFPGDAVNDPAGSDPAAIVIDQRQQPYFSIATTNAIAPSGSPVTISGALLVPHTTDGKPGVSVGLYGKVPGGAYALAQTTTTGAGGAYQFTVENTTNVHYRVKMLSGKGRATAVLFQGVEDAVSFAGSTPTSTVGDTVTFTGSVAPDKSGRAVYLERLGRDGGWHVVETGQIATGSTFSFNWTFGNAGTKQFRARVLGDPDNVGGASAPVTVVVGLPPISGLPSN
jgi:hypothetical protein